MVVGGDGGRRAGGGADDRRARGWSKHLLGGGCALERGTDLLHGAVRLRSSRLPNMQYNTQVELWILSVSPDNRFPFV